MHALYLAFGDWVSPCAASVECYIYFPERVDVPNISLSVDQHTSGFGVLVKGLRRLSLTLILAKGGVPGSDPVQYRVSGFWSMV